MALKYDDWCNEGYNDLLPVDFATGQKIWNACLQACADHCRQLGQEALDGQQSSVYVAMHCKKKLDELADQLEEAQGS